MLLLMSITIHMSFKITQNLTTYKKQNKKYKKDYIGLIGLLQTIRGKQPLTGKQGQSDFNQKDYYGLWTNEI